MTEAVALALAWAAVLVQDHYLMNSVRQHSVVVPREIDVDVFDQAMIPFLVAIRTM